MEKTHSTRRIGAAQVAEVYMDREATVEKDIEYIHEAGKLDLDMLVFPEFHIPAAPGWYRYIDTTQKEYYKQLFDNAVTVPGPAIDQLCEAARQANVAVVMGINEKIEGTAGTMYNSLVFIDNEGSLLGVRRKLVPTNIERLFHAGGTGKDVCVFDSSLGTISGLMCGEHTNHLASYSVLAQGEELHAAAWPAFPQYDRDIRKKNIGIRTRYHAFTGGVPVASASGVVTEELAEAIGVPDLSTDSGTSSIIAPSGEYLAGPKWEGEGIVHAEIDLGNRVRSKATHDITGHYNRFDIFSLTINRQSHDPIKYVNENNSSSEDEFSHLDSHI